MIINKLMIKWSLEEVIFTSGSNVIIIKLSQQKMEQEDKRLLHILLPKTIFLSNQLMKVEM